MATRRNQGRIREALNRYRPGPATGQGTEIWAPMPEASADRQDTLVGPEVETIARTVAEAGVISRQRLYDRIDARFWGPGRFRRAVHEAISSGRVERLRRGMYRKPASEPAGEPAPTA